MKKEIVILVLEGKRNNHQYHFNFPLNGEDVLFQEGDMLSYSVLKDIQDDDIKKMCNEMYGNGETNITYLEKVLENDFYLKEMKDDETTYIVKERIVREI